MIGNLTRDIKSLAIDWTDAWNRFWFTPRTPETLSLLRIATGLMLLYSHLVLAGSLTSFLGPDAWINNALVQDLHTGPGGQQTWVASYLWHIDSPAILWCHHLFTTAVTLAFAIGFLTRITAPLAVFLQLMYLHRLTGALFGLDQIVTYSALYLSLTPCGSLYSVDAWLRKRKADTIGKLGQWLLPSSNASTSVTIATRLLQLHLCAIYLFGGLAKARGEMWWDGTAVWFAVANYEYQSVDMTWMAAYPKLFSMLTHVTLFWEVFYCALVWPKLTRPIILLIAVAVHAGIAMFLGMITFGVMMIAANMIFVEPSWLRSKLSNRPALKA